LINFENFCIFGNRNEYSTRQTQIISLQPYYVSTLPDKTKNSIKTPDRLLQHLVEPIVPKFYKKSFNVRFFPYLLEHSFSSLSTKNLSHSRWFYQKIILKLIWLILTCKLKLNCRDMRHVTAMTSSI